MMGSIQVSKLYLGPDLYRVSGTTYECSTLEYWGRCGLATGNVVRALTTFFSPFVLFYLYRKEFFSSPEPTLRWLCYTAVFYVGCYTLKATGRLFFDGRYRQFLRDLDHLHSHSQSASVRREFALKYDCAASGLPVDYGWQHELAGEPVPKRKYLQPKPDYWYPQTAVGGYLLDGACYLATHSLGISMMFPGCTRLINTLVQTALIDGRTKLIAEHGGMRYKLSSRLNDSIDCMFVDKRNKTHNGGTLFITCEGNAGFYELGSTTTPVQAGYSVLGWNHPGFAGSDGAPYPPRDAAAVDVVVQFAITKLGFDVSDIVIYGWSIGGFSGSYAAMNYPNLKGVVLDATFDDVAPMARQQFPQSIEHLTLACTRTQLDLPVARQLLHYQGPILLIRRIKDEIICTQRANDAQKLRSNRANDLLLELLTNRYPDLTSSPTDVSLFRLQWLHAGCSLDADWPADAQPNPVEQAQAQVLAQLDMAWCRRQVLDAEAADSRDQGRLFPSSVGRDLTSPQRVQLLVYLANAYMTDFDSGHNNPLAVELLTLPQLPAHNEA